MCNLALIGGVAALLGCAVVTRAAEPRIDYIEMFLKTNVLIHFDTQPNRAYILQYTETLGAVAPGLWTNLYVAPVIPFEGHYIVPDTALRRQRFYRLVASP